MTWNPYADEQREARFQAQSNQPAPTSVATGRIVTRRETLRLLAAGSGALLTRGSHSAATAPSQSPDRRATLSCTVTPEQTEGPFFVDEKLARSDLRTEPSTGTVTPGVPLGLTFKVSMVTGTDCAALSGAQVDLWQCDAAGRYSDVGRGAATADKFLRGYQLTDTDGRASFTTIYPGGYAGRAVHIHFKIRGAGTSGRRYELTSQLYFDDAITDVVHANPPYAGRASRAMRNADDFIFRDGGRQLLVPLVRDAQGYRGSFDIALRTA
jgi:protocatechuate 3,4-dioxygenase beta subunit